MLLTNLSHWADYLQMTLRSVIQIRIQCSWKMLLIMIWMKWIYGKKKWLMSFNPDKTEIMIFSNHSIPENIDFISNGKSVPITTSHKHLGVTFSNDAKWFISSRNCIWPILSTWCCPWKFKAFLFWLSNIRTSQNYIDR